jgi:hypothetical protein
MSASLPKRQGNLLLASKQVNFAVPAAYRPQHSIQPADDEAIGAMQVCPIVRDEAVKAIQRRLRVLKFQLRLRFALLRVRYLLAQNLCAALHCSEYFFRSR